jgi:hypothetical protein
MKMTGVGSLRAVTSTARAVGKTRLHLSLLLKVGKLRFGIERIAHGLSSRSHYQCASVCICGWNYLLSPLGVDNPAPTWFAKRNASPAPHMISSISQVDHDSKFAHRSSISRRNRDQCFQSSSASTNAPLNEMAQRCCLTVAAIPRRPRAPDAPCRPWLSPARLPHRAAPASFRQHPARV